MRQEGQASWTGVAGLKRVSAGFVRDVRIAELAWALKEAVVDFLDRECTRIDELNRDLQRHRASADELDRRFLDDLFGEAPLTRLGWRAKVQTGLTLGARHTEAEVEKPYLRVANVQSDRIVTDDVATVAIPADMVGRVTLRAGDVLLTEGGDMDKLGRGAVWDGRIADCLHQNHVFAVRCGPELDPVLLALWTRGSTARSYFERTASRITNIASTNLTKLRRLPVPDLSLAEQRRVLHAYRAHEVRTAMLRELTQGLQDGLGEYRDALITEAVTGKLDVTKMSEQQLDEYAHAATEGERPKVLSV